MKSKKEESEEINELLGFNLDEIFEATKTAVPNFLSFPESIKNAEINMHFHKKMAGKIVSEFEANDDITASTRISHIFEQIPPVRNYALLHRIFNEAIRKLKEKHEKYLKENPDKDLSKYERAAEGVSFFAEMHFTKEVEKELADYDLATQLKHIKKYLLDHEYLSIQEPFLYRALVNLKTKNEREISLEIERKHNKKQLETPEFPPAVSKKNGTDIIEGDLRQKTFVILILLFGKIEIPNAKEDLRTSIIDLVAFLTGQSRQNVKKGLQSPTAYKEGSKKSRDKIISDLRIARDFLRRVGSTKAENIAVEAKAILDIEREALEEATK